MGKCMIKMYADIKYVCYSAKKKTALHTYIAVTTDKVYLVYSLNYCVCSARLHVTLDWCRTRYASGRYSGARARCGTRINSSSVPIPRPAGYPCTANHAPGPVLQAQDPLALTLSADIHIPMYTSIDTMTARQC